MIFIHLFKNYVFFIFETRMWFLRPSRDISLLQQRQKAVSYFMNLRNSELVASLQDCLKHIKNVSVSISIIWHDRNGNDDPRRVVGCWASLLINTHSVNILVYFWTTLDWHSIKILIDTQSTLVWQFVDSWQSVKCQPTQMYMSTLSGVSVKIRWLSTDCWPRSWLCVDWVVMKRLIKCWSRCRFNVKLMKGQSRVLTDTQPRMWIRFCQV